MEGAMELTHLGSLSPVSIHGCWLSFMHVHFHGGSSSFMGVHFRSLTAVFIGGGSHGSYDHQ